MKGWKVNDELERIWKEAVAANFKAPSPHSHRATEENHKNSQDSWSPCRDLNLGLSDMHQKGLFYCSVLSISS
jgi:hypothetical protein